MTMMFLPPETMALNLRMVKTDIDLESIADELQYTPKDEVCHINMYQSFSAFLLVTSYQIW